MKQAIVTAEYIVLFALLGAIVILQPKDWTHPIVLMVIFFGFNWLFAESIYRTIGIYHRTIVISLLATLTTLFFHASGLLASAVGLLSVPVVIVVDHWWYRQDRISEAVKKPVADLTKKLGSNHTRNAEPLAWEAQSMSQEPNNLEKLKFDLELEKFSWQKTMEMRQNRFFNRNFGVIVTTIVSIAAVTVSYVQLNISSNTAQSQLDNERLKSDRLFYVEVAKFFLDRQQQMATRDKEEVLYLRNVVIASFPPDVGLQISKRMRDTAATGEIRSVWQEAVDLLGSPAAR